MPIGAILGAGSAIVGAVSSNKATKAQTANAEADRAYQQDVLRQNYALQERFLAASRGTQTDARDQTLGYLGETRDQNLGLQGDAMSRNVNLQRNARDQTLGYLGPARDQTLKYLADARGQSVNALKPFSEGGKAANDAYLFELGIGDRPAGYGGFTVTPSYDFRLAEGQDAVNALAGAKGGLNSGRTLEDLASFNQGIASQEYDSFLGRLNGTANTGYNAALSLGNIYGNYATGASNAQGNYATGASNAAANYANNAGNAYSNYANNAGNAYTNYGTGAGTAANNYATGIQNAYNNFTAGTTNANNNAGVAASNAYTAIGNAQAAGAIGVGNALNSGIQNYIGYQQYQNGLSTQGQPGMTYGTPYGAGMSGSQLIPPRF